MSIQRLPVFLEAAKQKNFSAAAKVLCISQTAVSQQIKLLEDELGFQLFNRSRKGVTLTQAGEAYYRQCRQVMSSYNSAVYQSRRIAQGDPDTLSVGYCGAYDLWVASKLVHNYCTAKPGRRIELHSGTGRELVEKLANGEMDLAVLSSFGLERESWLGIKPISLGRCMLMISSINPLARKQSIKFEELTSLPVVLTKSYHLQTAEEVINEMYMHLGLGENERVYADDFYSLVLLVSADMGVSIAPESVANMGLPGIRLVPIEGFHRVAKTLIAYPKNAISTATANLLEMLQNT